MLKIKRWFFEKISRMYKLLARLIGKKKEENVQLPIPGM